jgi:hypothetical protein
MPTDLYASEREEFEAMLNGKSRENLRAVDLGSTMWSPLPLLSPEAMGHFMPRLIDFALSGELDYDGQPFLGWFINMSLSGPNEPDCSLFKAPHKTIVYECLVCLQQEYSAQVEQSCWTDQLRSAIALWNPGQGSAAAQ